MASVTKYPGTVSQYTGGAYVSFDNLENIKNNVEGSWAVSHELIKGRKFAKCSPSTIVCTNFNFNLPLGAEPTKVVVYYRHRKVHGNDYSAKYPKRIMNIGGPDIFLRGLELNQYEEVNKTGFVGVAPKADGMHTQTKTFKITKATRNHINSSNFGVLIAYPSNSNDYDGYMRVSFVRIEVEYKVPSYSLGLKKTSGGFNKEDYVVELSISNKNRTGYNPSCTLSSPVGFSFKSASGTGVLSQNSARSFSWNPKLNKNVGTSSINVVFTPDVSYPSGQSSYSGTFTLSESLYSGSVSHTATITERPPSPTVEIDDVPYDEETLPDNLDYTVLVSTLESKETLEFDPRTIYELMTPLLNNTSNDDQRIMYLEVSVTEPVTIDYIMNGETETVTVNDTVRLPLADFPTDSIHPRLLVENYQFYSYDVERTTITAKLICAHVYKQSQYSPWLIMVGNPLVAEYYDNSKYLTDYLNNNLMGMAYDYDFSVDFVPTKEIVDSYDTPFLTLMEPTQEEQDRLGTGYTYICQADIKHITDDTFIRDWYKNNRIGIFNNPIEDNITVEEVEIDGEIVDVITDTTDYDNLTIDEIYENAEYWSTQTGGLNEYANVECEFTYNEDYPLYVIMTGDYDEAEDYGFDKGSIKYNTTTITEKTNYNGRKTENNHPFPINNLTLTDGSNAEITIPTLHTDNTTILYDYPLSEDYGTNETISIRGLEVTGNIEQSDELVLTCTLTSPTGASGERSIILDQQNTTIDSDTYFKFGGLGDLWGFNTNDITNLEDWEIRITANNLLTDDEASINFGNIQFTIYTEDINKQNINIKIDGEDLSYYGAFITNVHIPEGLSTDTSFLTIDGTDTNDAYRQNIREKTIDIELEIGECDLQNSTDMLRQLTKVLVNDKDQYNRPIPNIIEFSHYPDVYFEYIMTDTLDITNEIGAYNVKAKLTIPSGTAYSKQSTTTNITGFVQGIAAINPKISFKPQGETIIIKEEFTGQSFTMGYSGDWQTMIVELDCEDRKAYLKNNEDDTQATDISKYVDFNSDWFSLHGEYSFSASGCVIRTVEFTERW